MVKIVYMIYSILNLLLLICECNMVHFVNKYLITEMICHLSDESMNTKSVWYNRNTGLKNPVELTQSNLWLLGQIVCHFCQFLLAHLHAEGLMGEHDSTNQSRSWLRTNRPSSSKNTDQEVLCILVRTHFSLKPRESTINIVLERSPAELGDHSWTHRLPWLLCEDAAGWRVGPACTVVIPESS